MKIQIMMDIFLYLFLGGIWIFFLMGRSLFLGFELLILNVILFFMSNNAERIIEMKNAD